METDPALARFAGQFVPLKVITAGDQWQQWSRKFKREGRSIPIIYVVRADGEQLYGKSGALSGEALPELLNMVAQRSGRIFNEEEYLVLESCNRAAQQAMDNSDFLAAAVAMKPVVKIGTPGELQSYAEPAIKADELGKKIVEQAATFLSEVDLKLKDPATNFEALIDLSGLREQGAHFPPIKQSSGALLKQVSRDKTQRALLKPAKDLFKARVVGKSEKKSDKKRAEKAYGSIIKRFADTPAAELARKELAELNPTSIYLQQDAKSAMDSDRQAIGDGSGDDSHTAEKMRNWSNSTGKFSVEARLLEATDKFVRLKTIKGKEIKVPIEKLNDAAREYLEGRR